MCSCVIQPANGIKNIFQSQLISFIKQFMYLSKHVSGPKKVPY